MSKVIVSNFPSVPGTLTMAEEVPEKDDDRDGDRDVVLVLFEVECAIVAHYGQRHADQRHDTPQ